MMKHQFSLGKREKEKNQKERKSSNYGSYMVVLHSPLPLVRERLNIGSWAALCLFIACIYVDLILPPLLFVRKRERALPY